MKIRTLPRFSIRVIRRNGAPKIPSVKHIEAALIQAWRAIPASRFPEAFAQTRIAIDVQLVNDEEIAEFNARHMNHSGPTDVLSFPIGALDPERNAFLLGEILASFETAQREARERKIPAAEELLRYVLHGFLHCMNYDDSTPAKRRAMFEIQEKALNDE